MADEFAYLEDIHGDEPLAWVERQNARTESMLAGAEFDRLQGRILEVLDSCARIPMPVKHGDFYYNFWRDDANPHGLWRRTTPESYRTSSPDWEVLLDVDELCRAEQADWVFAGAVLRYPDYSRALIKLSPDGGDAVTVREFDVETKQFVTDGFAVDTAKTSISWIDEDTVFIATDFGPDTMTTSSYPAHVRRWRRGQALSEAEPVLQVPSDHLTVGAGRDHTPGFERELVYDALDFFTTRTYLLDAGGLTHIDVPDDAVVDVHREWLLVRPRTDWAVNNTTYPAGSLIAARFDDFLAGSREFTVLFAPDEHTSLDDWNWTRHHLLLTVLADVASRVEVLTPDDGWSRAALPAAPDLHTISVAGVDAKENDDYWMIVTGFLTPSQLWQGSLNAGPSETATLYKSAAEFFDASGLTVQQHFAVSKDGTRVPYFQVSPEDADGAVPALLTGYGGFELSQVPSYSGTVGRAWLERGGAYVVANIRGGGEYGPAWHRAALRENRPRAYEDFAAVAEDLISRGVTTASQLGCEGRSNGGLLVGNMLTTYPHLFGAISCGVPLLDMGRYTKLSAGTSWIAEYGDPDVPDDWEFIRTFSPYHNLETGASYPPTLFYTVTSDDRVGPVQARKMAARMQQLGHDTAWLYENFEGGHGGGSDNRQLAHYRAASYTFLFDQLVDHRA